MRNVIRAAAVAVAALGTSVAYAQAVPVIAGPSTGLMLAQGFGSPLVMPSVATDANLPLEALVANLASVDTADAEQDCLASAIYFEARGEPLSGQLAVADVVLNRVASPRYPDTICGVVKQPAQFSFVRRGVIPAADRSSTAWRNAVAVSRIAGQRLRREVAENVLWYHADYVRPSWGRRLTRQEKIGLHIFYS